MQERVFQSQPSIAGVMSGLLGILFAILGIFTLGLLFLPFAALFSLISLLRSILRRSAGGFAVAFASSILTIIGCIVSPSTWVALAVLVGAGLGQGATSTSLNQAIPTQIGACAQTRITSLEHRLRSDQDFDLDSGSAVKFANGAYQVGYRELPQIKAARVGDPVKLCLIEIPHGCPVGDNRGRVYTTTDLRSLVSWTLPDASHACGGA